MQPEMPWILNVRQYLESEATEPCLVVFSCMEQLQTLQKELTSCEKIRLSDYCSDTDAKPDLGKLLDTCKKLRGKFMLLGAGEYAALTEDFQFLRDISALVLASEAKLVVPLWNCYDFISRKTASDPRWEERGIALQLPNSPSSSWRVEKVKDSLPLQVQCNGFKQLLGKLEKGYEGKVTTKTAVQLSNRLVKRMESAFAAYMRIKPASKAQENLFPEEIWETFLAPMRSRSQSLESADMLLHLIENPPENPYLRLVLETTTQFAEYEDNLLCALLKVSAETQDFSALYDAKKEALAGWITETRAALYVKAAGKFIPEKRIAYLSCETICEKKAILQCIAEIKRVPETLPRVWPDLANYLKPFPISTADEELSRLLNSYFDEYKKCKLFNAIPSSFLEKVNDIAMESQRPYYRLPTRGRLVDSLKADGTFLYWLDALGCEYLSFIKSEATRCGLLFKVQPGRADLPTITSVNHSFWDEWNGEKEKSKKLDKIKHGEFADDKTESRIIPANLIDELLVIREVMEQIAALLKEGKVKRVVLASDHGTTRLAVISGVETTWEMPEKGEHGGRCCKKSEFQGELPPYATESDDARWYALANYDRFKGGRSADVEVHGGASVEEIVVPVIEFSLPKGVLKVELLTPAIKTTHHDATITLKFFSRQLIEELFVEYQGKRYRGIASRDGNIEVELPKPQAGECEVEVFSGDTSIGKHRFSVSNAGVTIRDDDGFFQ